MKNQENPAKYVLPKKLESIDDSFNTNPCLLLIANPDTLKVRYINNVIQQFCGIEPDSFYKGELCFYTDFIHPEDRADYLVQFNSCKALTDGEEKEFVLRLRDIKGNWNKFCFKDRLYKGNRGKTKETVLSLVHRIPSVADDGQEANACKQEDPEQNLPPTRYHQLLNSIDEGFCKIEMIFNSKGRAVDFLFIRTNPAFEKQTNLKDATGKTMRELIPDHEEYWFKTYGEVALTGESVRFQERAGKLNNSWYDVYAFRVGGEESRRVAILFQNITERKTTEENLLKENDELEENAKQQQQESLESSQLLQTVFDTTNLAIAVFQTLYAPNGTINDFLFIRVNKVLQDMYSPKDVLGQTYTESIKDSVQPNIFDDLKIVMETGEILDKEFRIKKKGCDNWFRVIARKQDTLLIASIEDITGRKAEAQQLEEAVKFNKQLVQTSPDTILIVNLNDFNIRYINKDLLTRAGMRQEKILGMSLPEILVYMHPRDREKIISFHKKLLKASNDEIFDIEFRVKTRISSWEWFHARGKIFDRESEKWVNEYVVLVRNITEQKDTQRALINAEKLSIQGEVARIFAHELRNPLASIGMATDVIKKKLGASKTKAVDNYFGILSRSTKMVNDMVSNLLNSTNYSPAVLKKENLAAIVDEVLVQAADRLYLAGIKVTKNYHGPYSILADKEKLKIALLNIIVNASEATNPDEGTIEIGIRKFKTDFLLDITDNGHGLEQKQIDRLFDAFYSNKPSGVGVGLNSVKNILEEHDAQIEVESEPREGTTFKIYFHNTDND